MEISLSSYTGRFSHCSDGDRVQIDLHTQYNSYQSPSRLLLQKLTGWSQNAYGNVGAGEELKHTWKRTKLEALHSMSLNQPQCWSNEDNMTLAVAGSMEQHREPRNKSNRNGKGAKTIRRAKNILFDKWFSSHRISTHRRMESGSYTEY